MDPKKAAILFVDVCGSTAFFDRYGEVAGHGMVEHCFKVIVPSVETQGGRCVKFMGDGFLAVFDGAEAAVDAAAAMHSSLPGCEFTRGSASAPWSFARTETCSAIPSTSPRASNKWRVPTRSMPPRT